MDAELKIWLNNDNTPIIKTLAKEEITSMKFIKF
jgi:hypothetical protein